MNTLLCDMQYPFTSQSFCLDMVMRQSNAHWKKSSGPTGASTRPYPTLAGDPTPKDLILVHDRILGVTKNLHSALLHLRHEEMPRYIWVDAIW